MAESFDLHFPVGTATFSLPLQRKALKLGNTTVEQFWIDSRSLYGQRNRPAGVHSTMLAIYWEVCSASGAISEADTKETYLLASLLPKMRANGSQRVFLDARVKRDAKRKQETLRELNSLILASNHQRMTGIDFQAATLAALGRPEYSTEERNAYLLLSTDLLREASLELRRDRSRALASLFDSWARLQRRFGRRAEVRSEKTALDALSYEARAAFHRCYSTAWQFVLPALDRQFSLPNATKRFSEFWHHEHGSDVANLLRFRLFHGHIFALHPAAAGMIQTKAGSQALDEWLQDSSEVRTERLLQAFLVAMHHYAGVREDYNSNRNREAVQSVADFHQAADQEDFSLF